VDFYEKEGLLKTFLSLNSKETADAIVKELKK